MQTKKRPAGTGQALYRGSHSTTAARKPTCLITGRDRARLAAQATDPTANEGKRHG